MNVLINDTPIDIQLQGETSLFEVVRQLDAWLSEQGHALIGLSVDGKEVDLGGADWRALEPSAVGQISIEAPRLHDLRLANLAVLNQYAERLHAQLVDLSNGEPTLPLVLQSIRNYPDIRPALSYLTENLSGSGEAADPLAASTDQAFAATRNPDGSFNAEAVSALARQVHGLVVISRDRINEASDPVREARLAAALLQELIPRLGMVSTQLLTNQPKEAFDTILQFSELLGKLLRLFWLMLELRDPGSPAPYSRDELQGWAQMINGCLTQISEALDSQDTVLLGDLLEYELPGHLERLFALIPSED